MTGELFTKWLKSLDIKMGQRGRKIVLLLDNFSGHYVDYTPKNIQVEFFVPNLTSFVQPCDAGIIRCFKAHYRHAFCMRALDLEEAGEQNIYKVNLLEAMLMAKQGWDAVTQETILHCWNHTKIQQNLAAYTAPPQPKVSTTATTASQSSNVALADLKAWDIIKDFARSEITLPQAEERLKSYLGTRYVEAEWSEAFKAVMDAENDIMQALELIGELTKCLAIVLQAPQPPVAGGSPNNIPLPLSNPPQQLVALEQDLEKTVAELKKRNRITGSPLTLEEMLNPVLEREIGDSCYRFEGGDQEIVEQVKHEMAIQSGEVIEVDSDSEEEAEEGDKHSIKD
ncbi:hypothetical protein M422DRAFT_248844, partial [Sphaerobolus stellatus SS14]